MLVTKNYITKKKKTWQLHIKILLCKKNIYTNLSYISLSSNVSCIYKLFVYFNYRTIFLSLILNLIIIAKHFIIIFIAIPNLLNIDFSPNNPYLLFPYVWGTCIFYTFDINFLFLYFWRHKIDINCSKVDKYVSHKNHLF